MIELKCGIILDNGVEIGHLVVSSITMSLSKIDVRLIGFIDESVSDKVKDRTRLMKEQEEIVKVFDEEMENSLTAMNEEVRVKLNSMQLEVNTLADEIDKIPSLEDLMIETIDVQLPYKRDITVEELVEELKTTELLKDIELCKEV